MPINIVWKREVVNRPTLILWGNVVDKHGYLIHKSYSDLYSGQS
jgi:hypothetical protein